MTIIKSINNLRKLSIVLAYLLLGTGIVISIGCQGEKTELDKKFVPQQKKIDLSDKGEKNAKLRSEEKPSEERDFQLKIAKANNLFQLYGVEEELNKSEKQNRTLDEQIRAKRGVLLSKRDIITVMDGIKFTDFSFENIGGDKYCFSWYFIITKDIPKKWSIFGYAFVDKSHVEMIPPEFRKGRCLKINVHPDTTTWKAGEHIVVKRVAELKPIPYHFYWQFYDWPNRQAGSEKIDEGWIVAVGENF